MQRAQKRLPAFTLIELLAVVAIVLLLLSLLVPTLRASRKRAELVPCMNNLRQLYSLCLGYAGENSNQDLPQGLSENPEQLSCRPGSSYATNFARLSSYMAQFGFTRDVWYCPSFPDVQLLKTAWGDSSWYNSGKPRQTGTPGEFPIGYFYLGNSSYSDDNYNNKFIERPPRTLHDLMNTNKPLAGDYCLAPSPGYTLATQVPLSSWSVFPHYGVEEPLVSQSVMANGSVRRKKIEEMRWNYSYWAAWEIYW